MYEYRTKVVWDKNRLGILSCDEKMSMDFSSPPEFKGLDGFITPEDLYIAAENSCFLMTFVSVSEKMRLEIDSYECEAVGYLEKVDRSYLFTRIILHPRIVVKSERDIPRVVRALEIAQKNCLVGNSMKTEIQIDPEILPRE